MWWRGTDNVHSYYGPLIRAKGSWKAHDIFSVSVNSAYSSSSIFILFAPFINRFLHYIHIIHHYAYDNMWKSETYVPSHFSM